MCKGRCNFFIFDEPHLRLCVVSFRYRHTYVDEFDNPQLLCYDSGLMDRFSINGKSDQWLRVENTIIQPRCYQADPIRTHKFTALTRRAEFNKLASAAAEKIGGEGKCVPGPYCSECSAIYNCSAAFGSGIALYEAATQPSIADMEPTELSRRYGLILRAQERIKALANSYGSHIEAILHKGTVVPGYLLEDSFGNLDWSVPMAEVIALGELLGKNLKKDGVITPTQAKALGIDEATIAAYSTRKKQGRKLIPENKLTRKIEGALNG